jgi:hypothetical protein
MRPVEKHERRQCPPEFQERLTRLFGVNQFGEPHFKISWGMSEFIRMGDIWRDRYGNERRGYRDTYQCHGTPCWNIMRWKQPAHYGSPETYYQNTWDDFSKMHFLGEYPWRGRYEIVQPLMRQEMTEGKIVTEWIPSLNPHTGIIETIPVRKRVGQKLIVHHMPLSHILIDKIIPLIMKVHAFSQQELQAIHAANKLAEHKKEVEQVADAMAENMPTYFGPVSYSRQGVRTSLLDRKMEAIEKVWKRELAGKKRFTKGFQIADRPIAVAR